MRTRRKIAMGMVTMLGLTACTNINGAQGPHDWFGNPLPTTPQTCALPRQTINEVGQGALNPHLDKPAITPPGHRWITYGLKVLALSSDLKNDICVPIHITYTRSSELGTQILGEQVVDFDATTPWQGFVSFDYDPTAEEFAARPPNYRISLTASYYPGTDIFHKGETIGLGCYIQIEGAAAAGGIAPTNQGAVCTASLDNNRFNLA